MGKVSNDQDDFILMFTQEGILIPVVEEAVLFVGIHQVEE